MTNPIGKIIKQIQINPVERLKQIKTTLLKEATPQSHLIIHFASPKSTVSDAHNCDSNSIFGWGSISKFFTAALTCEKFDNQKQTLGKLGVTDFGEPIANLRLEQLLNHTAGLHDYHCAQNEAELTTFLETTSKESLIKLMLERNSSLHSDNLFRYSNSHYLLLQHLLEKNSGQSFQDLIRARFSQKGKGLTSIGFYEDFKNFECLSFLPYTFSFNNKNYDWSQDSIVRLGTGDGGLFGSMQALETSFKSVINQKTFKESYEAIRTPMNDADNSYYGAGVVDDKAPEPTYWHNGAIGCWRSLALYKPAEDTFIGILQTLNNDLGELTSQILDVTKLS